ncbi:hypothetical protein GH721_07470 [Kriegella sp. EG-1]|nr:hypothetical protein [Flavobacteriaceae bacterium EG-1]
MNHFNIVICISLSVFFPSLAQTTSANTKLLAVGTTSEVIEKEVGPNTVIYSYRQKDHKNDKIRANDHTNHLITNENDSFEYPSMKVSHGAVLPFEFIFDGSANSQAGIEAQEFYFNTLMNAPELNKIIYQDIETTRERLNNAGIYDAKDLNYFDMPLIAKIVGAGILVTAKITINTSSTAESTNNDIQLYNTETIFKIYNKDGKPIFFKKEAPFTPTSKNSYQLALNYFMKQTPYYHKL